MRFYCWVVEFGKGLRAFFADKARADQASVDLHGIVREVYVAD